VAHGETKNEKRQVRSGDLLAIDAFEFSRWISSDSGK
jgi:hypothetical protein